MTSLQEVNVKLQESGIAAARAKICSMAADIVKEIGRCYPEMANATIVRTLPTPAITERPSGMVCIDRVETTPTPSIMMSVASHTSDLTMGTNSITVPKSFYSIRDGVICFNSLLCERDVTITYRTMPISDDGWPMVHDALIEPIVFKLYNELVRGTMIRAALRSNPTNNMIIATKAEVGREYHRLISHARAQMSYENEGINLENREDISHE